jgi:hypothetical protein
MHGLAAKHVRERLMILSIAIILAFAAGFKIRSLMDRDRAGDLTEFEQDFSYHRNHSYD